MKNKKEKINNTKGNIAALQTILERYPVLLSTDSDGDETSLSFSLSILKMLGVTENDLLKWLGKLLCDEEQGGAKGFLTVMEIATHAVILKALNDAYTGDANPFLPINLMRDFTNSPHTIYGSGVTVSIKDIDAYGILKQCPVDENGKIFYFDNANYKPSEIYKSTDFNAYLWYIINKATDNSKKAIWDNRCEYYTVFRNNGYLNDDSAGNGKSKFIDSPSSTAGSHFVGIDRIGKEPLYVPKKELIYTEYKEIQSNGETDLLNVWLNYHAYYGKLATLQQFNIDYLASLKLFDSKTLTANIINAVLGIFDNMSITLQRKITQEQLANVVKTLELEEDTQSDCFFSFKNDKYNALLERATLKYEKMMSSGNESMENITFTEDELNEFIEIINAIDDKAELDKSKEETISRAFETVSGTLAKSAEVDEGCYFSFKNNIITKFIEEAVIQMSLQILSPKVMLLFEINEKIASPKSEHTPLSFEEFFGKFKNMLTELVASLLGNILRELWELVMSFIKPWLSLIVEKLLLENILLYVQLLEALVGACSFDKISLIRKNITIDNVQYADIVPTKESPEISC